MPPRSRSLPLTPTWTRARTWRCSATPRTTPPWISPSPGFSTESFWIWRTLPDRTTVWRGWERRRSTLIANVAGDSPWKHNNLKRDTMTPSAELLRAISESVSGNKMWEHALALVPLNNVLSLQLFTKKSSNCFDSFKCDAHRLHQREAGSSAGVIPAASLLLKLHPENTFYTFYFFTALFEPILRKMSSKALHIEIYFKSSYFMLSKISFVQLSFTGSAPLLW